MEKAPLKGKGKAPSNAEVLKEINPSEEMNPLNVKRSRGRPPKAKVFEEINPLKRKVILIITLHY